MSKERPSFFIRVQRYLHYLYYYRFGGYRRQLTRQVQKSPAPLRLIIGAGPTEYKGWIPTDYPVFDATNEEQWKEILKNRKVKNLLAEHVFEHLTYEQDEAIIKNAAKFLEKNGVFRIAVPDAMNPNPEYIEYTRPGGSGIGAHDHKTFWDYKSLGNLLEKNNFTCNCIEYYDEYGNFHGTDFSFENGNIMRSKVKGFTAPEVPNFSSLIIDAIKK